MKESEFRRKLVQSFRHYNPQDFIISFPSMYIPGGIPDIIMCTRAYNRIESGQFVGIECKIINKICGEKANSLKHPFTPIQIDRAKKIREAGGKVLGVVYITQLKRALLIWPENWEGLFLNEDSMEYGYPMWLIDKKTKLFDVNNIWPPRIR